MVRIIYNDACLVQHHLFEIEKFFDEVEIKRKLERILWILDKSELSFSCGRVVNSSNSDEDDTVVFYLTFDTTNEDVIHDISIVLDIALVYSA